MTHLPPPPDRLFDDQGRPRFGVWRGYGNPARPQDFALWRDGKLSTLLTEKQYS